MGAFDGRRTHHTVGGTTPALNAFGRIELPYHLGILNVLRKSAGRRFAAAAAGKTCGTLLPAA